RVVFCALRAALIVPATSPLVGSGSQVPTSTGCQVLGSPARASPLHLGLPGSASVQAAARCLVFVARLARPRPLRGVRFVLVSPPFRGRLVDLGRILPRVSFPALRGVDAQRLRTAGGTRSGAADRSRGAWTERLRSAEREHPR